MLVIFSIILFILFLNIDRYESDLAKFTSNSVMAGILTLILLEFVVLQ